jgi:hypothetical protein
LRREEAHGGKLGGGTGVAQGGTSGALRREAAHGGKLGGGAGEARPGARSGELGGGMGGARGGELGGATGRAQGGEFGGGLGGGTGKLGAVLGHRLFTSEGDRDGEIFVFDERGCTFLALCLIQGKMPGSFASSVKSG